MRLRCQVGQSFRSVTMGLRPTNRDENAEMRLSGAFQGNRRTRLVAASPQAWFSRVPKFGLTGRNRKLPKELMHESIHPPQRVQPPAMQQ